VILKAFPFCQLLINYRITLNCDFFTRLHVDDSDFALDKGLFLDNFKSEQYKKSGHPCKNDFKGFAKRIGVADGRVEKLLNPIMKKSHC